MRCGYTASVVWNFFSKTADPKHVKCLICRKYLRYFKNTTNLRHHLTRVHHKNLLKETIRSTNNNETVEFTACKLENLEPLPVTFEIVTPDSPSASQTLETETELDSINYEDEGNANTSIRPKMEIVDINYEEEGSPDTNTSTKTSVVWNYFTSTPNDEYATCNLCNITFKFFKNTMNLKQHLKGRHLFELQEIEGIGENENIAECIAESGNSEEARSIAYAINESSSQPEIYTEEIQLSNDFVKRTYPRKSMVWNYFDKSSDNKIATCRLCNKDMRHFGNTTNLRSHLNRTHFRIAKNETAKAEMVISQEANGNSNIIGRKAAKVTTAKENVSRAWNYLKKLPNKKVAMCLFCKKRFRLFNYTNLKAHLNRIHPNWSRKNKLPAQFEFPLSNSKRKEIDKTIVTMLSTSYLPLSFVENAGFLEYSKKLRPAYIPPSKERLASVTVSYAYKESILKLKTKLELATTISVTIEPWTSSENKSYLTFTYHFIDNDKLYYNVGSTKEIFDLSSVENVMNVLLPVFNDWKIFNKIVTVVSNNINIRKCVHALLISYQPCVIHELNISITSAMSSLNTLTNLLKKCKNLTNHFKNTTSLSEKLKTIQEQMESPVLKIKLDKGTWHSQYFMMKRLLEIKNQISVIQTEVVNASYVLNTSEWDLISDCVLLLESLELTVSELVPERYPAISIIIPLIRSLYFSLKNKIPQTKAGRLFKTKLLKITSHNLKSLESNKIAARSTFLDPRFKTLAFVNEKRIKAVKNWIAEELLQTLDTTNDSAASTSTNQKEASFIWAYFDKKVADRKTANTPFNKVKSTISQYLRTPHLERNKDPLEFWKDHKMIFPELYGLAMKYLCIPAAAIPPERLFTANGRLNISHRNCLPSKNLDELIFLNSCLNRRTPASN